MRFVVLAAVVALAAGQAAAQTTRCAETVVGFTCRTTGPVDPGSVSPVPCNGAQRLLLGAEICGARDVAAARKRVGEMIAAGDCDGALKDALATGDLSFAKQVKDLCSTAGPSSR